MVAGLSFIGGFITEKFFVGRKIEQLRKDHSSKIELLREDNNSKIEQLKKDQNAIGELLRIIEIAEKCEKSIKPLSSFEKLEYKALTSAHEDCFPDPDEFSKTIQTARTLIMFIRADGYEKAKKLLTEQCFLPLLFRYD